MKSNYCSECGTKLLPDSLFCSECGTKITQEVETYVSINQCSKCGYSTTEKDIFCQECGSKMSQGVDGVSISDPSPLASQSNAPKKPSAKKVTARTKANRKHPSPRSRRNKKKKGGFLRSLGKIAATLLVVLIVGSVILYNLDDESWENEESEIVETPENNFDRTDNTPSETSSIPVKESKPRVTAVKSNKINQVANQVEEIFRNADTTGLKQILTSTSLKTYKGVYSSIAPYMDEYAAAFKNRKLEVNTTSYAMYSFKDKSGEEYTVEFALIGNGVWKLVRF